MKRFRVRTFVIFALASLAGAALLHTSQNVQQAEDRLSVLQAEIQKEKDMIHVLKTEWEYLNRPERLEKLAGEFLDLVPPAPEAMTKDVLPEAASLPERPVPQEENNVIPVSAQSPQQVDDNGVDEVADVPPIPETKPSALKSREPQKQFDALINELRDKQGGAQ